MSLKLTPAEHACPVLNKYSLDSVSSKNLHGDIITHTPRSDPHFCCHSRLNQLPSRQLLVTDMRLRSKLLYVLLALLFIVASIAEASRGGKVPKKKDKDKKPTLITPSGSGGGTLIRRNSGPRLESRKAKDNKASVGEASSTVREDLLALEASAILESDDDLGKKFREAVDGRNFQWLNANWGRWKNRKDLLDYVIAKGADVTVWLIQNFWRTKSVCLLHFLIREKG